MNNLLYIAPQDSLPYIDGGKIGIFFPIKEFVKKYNVFYTFPIQKIKEDTISKYKEFSVTVIPYQMDLKDNYINYPKTLFSDLSFKFSKFYDRNFLNKLSELVKEKNIDTVWVCHAQMAKYAIELKKQYPYLKTYLREHNIEYKLVKQYAISKTNILIKLIAYFEYLKTKNYEIRLWKKFDKVFFISDTDIKTARKYNKNIDASYLIYDGMEIPENDENIPVEENSFIFTGSLKSFQNENNLRYFIKNIWIPFSQKAPEAKLYITGNKEELLLSKIKMTKQELEQNNIINLGFVDDIKRTILSKQFVVSPTQYGSGIRLKVLEALSLKKVVFVSDIDYEMAQCFKDMENIVHYTDENDFYQKYKTIYNKDLYKMIAKNGYGLIYKNFNWDLYTKNVNLNSKQEENATNL